jgi:hypothetical protein
VGEVLDFTSSSCRLDLSAKEAGGGGGSRLDVHAPCDESVDLKATIKRDSIGFYEGGGGSQLRLVSFEEQEDVGGSSGELLGPKSASRHWGESSPGIVIIPRSFCQFNHPLPSLNFFLGRFIRDNILRSGNSSQNSSVH